MMKKILLIIVIAMLMLTSCQQPEESEEGKIIASAMQDKVNAPSDVNYESTQGRLKVVADAKVIVPDSYKMPIINVSSGVFSQEIVDKYWEELVGDTPMWEWADQPAKSDIEQMIINQRQYLEEAERRGDEARVKVLNSKINELIAMYSSAPESVDVMSGSSRLKEKVSWNIEFGINDTPFMESCSYSVQNQAEIINVDNWEYFCVRNPCTVEGEGFPPDASPASLTYQKKVSNSTITRLYNVDENTEISELVKKTLHTSPKEAKRIVEDFLSKTNTPMEVRSITLISSEREDEGSQHYAYSITCARVLDNGLSLMANPGSGISGLHFKGYMPPLPSVEHPRTWDYERMVIRIDDDGFFEIVWLAPIEILGTKSEDSKLLSFSDIQPVFDTMVFEMYEPHVIEGYLMTCEISKVRLELMRVWKPDSDLSTPEELLIPVWNYYGTLSLQSEDGDFSGGTIDEHVILSIDAIDGIVIDVSRGY